MRRSFRRSLRLSWRVQDEAEAAADGDEPLTRAAPSWLRLHFHATPAGALVPQSAAAHSRARPHGRDGARAVAALLAAARRQQRRAAAADAAAAAATAARAAAEAQQAVMVASVRKAYSMLDELETDVRALEVRSSTVL